jgi:uncharacterized tellurite resistance protein B-like protein
MIDKKIKAEILVRVALVDHDLASQEVAKLEDFSYDLHLEIDELYELISKYEKEDNNWEQLEPLFSTFKSAREQQIIIDSIKGIMEADFIIKESEQLILDKVFELYKRG